MGEVKTETGGLDHVAFLREVCRDGVRHATTGRDWDEWYAGAADELEALRSANARLRAALEPFAAIANDVGDDDLRLVPSAWFANAWHSPPVIEEFEAGDFRRAAEALGGDYDA